MGGRRDGAATRDKARFQTDRIKEIVDMEQDGDFGVSSEKQAVLRDCLIGFATGIPNSKSSKAVARDRRAGLSELERLKSQSSGGQTLLVLYFGTCFLSFLFCVKTSSLKGIPSCCSFFVFC